MRRSPSAVALLVLISLAVLVWGVAFASPLFDVRTVRVQGNVRLSAADVLELAGDLRGRNLVTLSLGDVEEALRRSPWIAAAEVMRSLPGTVGIEIDERRPAAWAVGGEAGAVIATDRVVLDHRTNRPAGLPSVGEVLALPLPGERLDGEAIRVVTALPASLRRQVSRAEGREGAVTLSLRDGGRVLFGPPDLVEEKSAVLASLLAWVRERQVDLDYIDIRAPSAPAVKPVGEATINPERPVDG